VQNSLGNALSSLGDREANPDVLREAVNAYRAALEVRTRAQAPAQWATTKNGMGLALMRLGRLGDGIPRLEEAVDAFRNALDVRTREEAPRDWAETQNNLALARCAWAECVSGAEALFHLQEAERACRAALEIFTAQNFPHFHGESSATMASIGTARTSLAAGEWPPLQA
jgi:tetratricopeptide (TPR) repeat protein